jgi:hypothetical protein
MNEDATTQAAINGHLEILQYLRQNECPWDENTLEGAVREKHWEVAVWAAENGCPGTIDVD